MRMTYGEAKNPAHEDKCTIEPPPLLAKCKSATLVPLITAVEFTSMIFSSALSIFHLKCKITYILFFWALPSNGVKYEFAPVVIPALSKAYCNN